VGHGLAEVGVLAALTIIVLPCGLFTLLALLDRFERSLDPDAQTPPTLVMRPAAAVDQAAEVSELDDEGVGGDVVELPIAVPVTQQAPAAATG
jgi:hypothetical protein